MGYAIPPVWLSTTSNEKLHPAQAGLNPITLGQVHYQQQGPSCAS